MAELFSTTATGSISSGGASTIMQLDGGARNGCIVELHVSFAASSNTASPILVECVRNSAGGTHSGTPAEVAWRLNPPATNANAETVFSVEPTEEAKIMSWYVPAYNGMFNYRFPPGDGIYFAGSDFIGIKCTASDTVNYAVTVVWLE